MKKGVKFKNLIIYLVLIFSMVSIIAIALSIQISQDNQAVSDNAFIFLDEEDIKTKIKLWRNSDDNIYYAFLPADAEWLSFNISDGFSINELPERINTSDLDFSNIYSASFNSNQFKIKFMKSGNIPSLFLDTETGKMDYINEKKGNYEKGDFLSIDGEIIKKGKFSKLNGRGNTSWTGCEKKGYKIEFEQEISLLGLEKSYEYILVANARSNYLSNTVSFWLEKEIGMKCYTNVKHLDLYFNGEYAGNYIICVPISTNTHGIDIVDLSLLNEIENQGNIGGARSFFTSKDGKKKGVELKKNPLNITGGYILERDVPEYYKDEPSGFILDSGDHYVLRTPKYASEAEVDYICNYMQELHKAVENPDGLNEKTGKRYDEYLDIDSFARKYVLEEFLAFNDSGRSSAYYYKDADDILHAGPGWDYEGVFLGDTDAITKLNSTYYSTSLYKNLLQHKNFSDKSIEIYKKNLLPALEKFLDTEFDKMANSIMASAKMDEIRWGREDFTQNCNDIKTWIEKRISFLNDMWLSDNEYFEVILKSDFGNNQYFYVKQGDLLYFDKLPELSITGVDFKGWSLDKENIISDKQININEDIVLYAIVGSDDSQPSVINLFKRYGELLPILILLLVFGLFFIVYCIKFYI